MAWVRALPREGPYLLGTGFGLAGLSALCGTARWRIGQGQYPIWLPVAIDAAIALAAGIFLVLLNERFETTDIPSSDEFVMVHRSVWDKVQSDVLAARGREPAAPPALASATPSPAAPPAVVQPWDEGPPIIPDVPAPRVVPTVSVPPPAPIPTLRPSAEQLGPSRRVIERVTAAKVAAQPLLTPEELEEIERLESILGFDPRKMAEEKPPAPRPAEEKPPAAPPKVTPPAPLPKPVPGPAPLPPPPAGDKPNIDDLMAWLDLLQNARRPSPPATPGAKPEEKQKSESSGG